MERTAHVSDFKKKIVEDIVRYSKEYPIVAVVNMENLPAPQLQTMRAQLRNKIKICMTKKTIMKIALEKIKTSRKGIEELENYFNGMPALIFTKDSPFKLSSILRKNKSKAPAKAGQIAPSDIIVPKGPTAFPPGPIISELSGAGLKVGVEGGKVAVKEDAVVARKGEKIKPKVAEILTRFDIKPMEVGLGLVVAYDNGVIYSKEILDVDEKEYVNNISLAAIHSFNLAFEITYVTKENVSILVGKAFTDAKALGLSQKVFDSGIIEELLGQAQRSMLSLSNTANIAITESHKEESGEEKGAISGQEQEKTAEPKSEERPEKKVHHEPHHEAKKEEHRKEDLKKSKEEDEQKKVEELAKELLKKGTLRGK